MKTLKLYMVILGCRPKGRWTEQHDVFFGIGDSLQSLVPQMKASWPEAKGNIHIDSWRTVTLVDGFEILIQPRSLSTPSENGLFFINLGGYKENEMEEYHYKILTIAENKNTAIKQAKATTFFKHTVFKGATSHIDDKYGIDVDDVFSIKDILPKSDLDIYQIAIQKASDTALADELHIGYLKLDKISVLY